jgi:hypothetical protein
MDGFIRARELVVQYVSEPHVSIDIGTTCNYRQQSISNTYSTMMYLLRFVAWYITRFVAWYIPVRPISLYLAVPIKCEVPVSYCLFYCSSFGTFRFAPNQITLSLFGRQNLRMKEFTSTRKAVHGLTPSETLPT